LPPGRHEHRWLVLPGYRQPRAAGERGARCEEARRAPEDGAGADVGASACGMAFLDQADHRLEREASRAGHPERGALGGREDLARGLSYGAVRGGRSAAAAQTASTRAAARYTTVSPPRTRADATIGPAIPAR